MQKKISGGFERSSSNGWIKKKLPKKINLNCVNSGRQGSIFCFQIFNRHQIRTDISSLLNNAKLCSKFVLNMSRK